MRVTTDTIERAIAHAAVMTNRPAWLAPDRLTAQREVWMNLVSHYSRGRGGMLSVDDFDIGLTELIDELNLNDVIPTVIVRRAVDHCTARFEGASTIIRLFHEDRAMVLQEARQRFSLKAADDAAAAKVWLASVVESMVNLLAGSGLPDDDVVPVMDHIRDEADRIGRDAQKELAPAAPAPDAAALDAFVQQLPTV